MLYMFRTETRHQRVKREQLLSKSTVCNYGKLSCQVRDVNGSLAVDWEGDGSSGDSLP
jgi:hypothetical protein